MTKKEIVTNLSKFEKRLKGCHRLLHDDETISEEEIEAVTEARILLERKTT